ncbi:MAG: hypothetical protein K6G26_01745 [Lachnospiraceae bacterium]|nr:hypothetical protein [Lachnospiraceae bacterium]
MGKKDDKKKNDDETLTKGGVILNIILSVLIALIVLLGFIAMVKLDINDFGSNVMRPLIKDWPVINKILPKEEYRDEEVKDYPYETMDEACEVIKELQKKIDKLQKENDDINTKVNNLNKENKKLKEYETDYKEFVKLKEEFEQEVVFSSDAPDITEYKKYYESIEPENAERLYKQVVEKTDADQEIVELANTYAKMEPANAAKALEEADESIGMVCKILTIMAQKNRAEIMDEMTPAFAAKVTAKIYSDNQ